ncbi:MAG: RNA-binding transcriptional accessory protein [Bacteroidaceae bacterium]|nr:RNA-binding transcriptional accessory protein [Bacteroidaceae bacterium]
MNDMMNRYISQTLNLSEQAVAGTLKLLADGATIPFISRYRKEATGGLDEVQIAAIDTACKKLQELAKRKETILSTIEEQGKLSDELRSRIEMCMDATELEDIYLPYKPKRRTRAEVARAKGLEPLAKMLMAQHSNGVDSMAMRFVKDEVKDADEALQGARDIIAEWVNESERARNAVRNIFAREARITSKVIKGKEAEGDKFRDYFDWSEPLSRCSSHRMLAIRRGEKEGFLRVTIAPADDTVVVERLERQFVRSSGECAEQVTMAVHDGYKRLLRPSIETEFANSSKVKADEEAIRVFATNLKQLLLAPPLGQKRVLAIDPGYRTGCKVVCLDAQGNLLHNETIYPHPPKSDYAGAGRKLTRLVEQYKIEAISIGNGTASRETEQFVTSQRYDRKLQVFVVSEDGASIYSASKVARDEFPDYDVTVRGAVSIGRRLMDPLAELVKIDPKSIGVGQYQYDVNQNELKSSLDRTVEHCVNLVGVNVNTASKHLLTYVSGLNATLAQNIVDYRAEHGAFASRGELKRVPRMGEKSFEQSAGFLRIPDAKNPLDNSAVHPERYRLVEQMARDLGCSVNELIAEAELRAKIDIDRYVSGDVGLPTLQDIMCELVKPGRDPRQAIEVWSFDERIRTIEDVKAGMVLPGIVTNVTNFGCFVDIGIKENGLVHVSQLADRYVSDPTAIVSVHQHVTVRVLEVDYSRKRISLSMKDVN